jgi:hypothetical protein
MEPQPAEEFDDPVGAMLIMLARQYDLLMLLARSADPEGAKFIAEAHERGHLLAAPPSYVSFEDEDD